MRSSDIYAINNSIKFLNVTKMKKNVIFIAVTAMFASVMFTGCKSNQPVIKETVSVVAPLSGKEYQTSKDFFRASQTGKSPDLATAKKIALANAKTELGSNIQSVIKVVAENYTRQTSVNDKQEYANKFEENAILAVSQKLSDVRIIGEEILKEKDGSFNYFIAIEMSKEPLINAVADRIAKEKTLQLDFDKQKFRAIFDDELEKLSKE
jgi:hypothetical protein